PPIAPCFSAWLSPALASATGREAAESIHLADFPGVEAAAVDQDLERRMELARTISSVVLALRNTAGINVRQPLPRILVVTGAGVAQSDVEAVSGIIKDGVNVKAIEYVSESSSVVKRSARPNFKRLGSRLGKLMKPVNEAVRSLDDDRISQYISEGSLTLDVDGRQVELGPGDLEVTSEGIAGWLVHQEDRITVALDTTITDELLAEGLAREVINRVQSLRKAADFDVTDRIAVQYRTSGELSRALREYGQWIRNETLALELEESDDPGGDVVESFDVGEHTLQIGLRRLSGDMS